MSERGMTLTGGVVDLLDRGLSALSDEVSVQRLQANLARVTAEKAYAQAESQTAQAQLTALGSFAQWAGRTVGACPIPRARSRSLGRICSPSVSVPTVARPYPA